MKYLLIIITLVLTGCASTNSSINKTSVVENREKNSQEEPSLSQRIYFFQHRLIPKWTLETEGRFFDDLVAGNLDKLRDSAREIVSIEYGDKVTSEAIDGHDAVLISFPTPLEAPHCFYVVILKEGLSYSYYTYEKTLSLMENDPVIGVVGSWSKDGTHVNLGPRTYRDSATFIKDVLAKKG